MSNTKIFSEKLYLHIKKLIKPGKRTYGYEYEFISDRVLTLDDMDSLLKFIESYGYSREGMIFSSDSGMYITIEPGGQIEYCSHPFLAEDNDLFDKSIKLIRDTNSAVKEAIGINYVGIGFIPDRSNAPLLLTAERYKNLHERMPRVGTRGHDMMKGTASIHLHVSINDINEMIPLYKKMKSLSESEQFKMSDERRSIWNDTDKSRCGIFVDDIKGLRTPRELVDKITEFTMNAEDLYKNVPFREIEDSTFDEFLVHLTTMFTDIRLNLKGPTVEMRTLDSVPVSEFEKKWKYFVNTLDNF
ncbi:MAG: hypothetical protein K9L30_18805 [Desulfobacterales bacterium]|nr:hypothetical protein [Desulfobacterales bacterium]